MILLAVIACLVVVLSLLLMIALLCRLCATLLFISVPVVNEDDGCSANSFQDVNGCVFIGDSIGEVHLLAFATVGCVVAFISRVTD
jgi:hypothetical protein